MRNIRHSKDCKQNRYLTFRLHIQCARYNYKVKIIITCDLRGIQKGVLREIPVSNQGKLSDQTNLVGNRLPVRQCFREVHLSAMRP